MMVLGQFQIRHWLSWSCDWYEERFLSQRNVILTIANYYTIDMVGNILYLDFILILPLY